MELPITSKLNQHRIPFRLIALRQAAMSVDDVALYAVDPVPMEEICKTVIVKGRKTGKSYGILLCGRDKIAFGKLKKILGEEAMMGSPEDVKIAAGVDPGAVCPFLLSVPLFMDQKIVPMKRINCGSGDYLHGLEFDPADLVRAVECTVVDVAK